METIHINLSTEMKEIIQSEVIRGGYTSTSEYVRALVQEDLRRKEAVQLESLILEGLNSGPPTEMTKEDWNSLKHRAQQRWDQRCNQE